MPCNNCHVPWGPRVKPRPEVIAPAKGVCHRYHNRLTNALVEENTTRFLDAPNPHRGVDLEDVSVHGTEEEAPAEEQELKQLTDMYKTLSELDDLECCVCAFGPHNKRASPVKTHTVEKHCSACRKYSENMYVQLEPVIDNCANCTLGKSAHLYRGGGTETMQGCSATKRRWFCRPHGEVALEEDPILKWILETMDTCCCCKISPWKEHAKVMISFGFQSFDWYSDVAVMREALDDGETNWATLFFVAFMIGNIVTAWVIAVYIFALRAKISERNSEYEVSWPRWAWDWTKVVFSVAGLSHVPFTIDFLAGSKDKREARAAAVLGCKQLEALFESAPQLLAQLAYIWLKLFYLQEDPGWIEWVSIALSALSIATAFIDASSETWMQCLGGAWDSWLKQVAWLWQLTDLVLHAVAYAVFAAAFRAWIILPLLAKAFAMAWVVRHHQRGLRAGHVAWDAKAIFVVGNLVGSFPATFGPRVLFSLAGLNLLILPALYLAPSFSLPPYRRIPWNSQTDLVHGLCSVRLEEENCTVTADETCEQFLTNCYEDWVLGAVMAVWIFMLLLALVLACTHWLVVNKYIYQERKNVEDNQQTGDADAFGYQDVVENALGCLG